MALAINDVTPRRCGSTWRCVTGPRASARGAPRRLASGGVQMVMMGVLGEYLWRALDESRRRPRYLIEATTGDGSLRPSPF
jgi:hypothetical protein